MKASGRWEGTVNLIGNQSILTDIYHQVPMFSMNFEGDNGERLVYLMSSCPGIFNGDDWKLTCRINEGAHLFLTDGSATELHPYPEESPMVQSMEFHIGENGVLEYMPEPIIPFKGSNYIGKTIVHMKKGSQAAISEIVAAGRVGRSEIFEYERFKSSFEVYREGRLEGWDTLEINPARNPKSSGAMGDYTHYGTLWLLTERAEDHHLERVRQYLTDSLDDLKCYGGASQLHENGIVVRVLGYNSENIRMVMDKVWGYFRSEFLALEPLEVLK